MSNYNTTKLIFRPMSVQNHVKCHQHPRQPRRLEGEQAQEAQPRIGIAPRPYVHQRATKRGSQERLTEHRRNGEQSDGGICEEPAEMSDRCRRLFEHSGVTLDEEDVEEEVEGQRAEVYEGRY